MLYKFNNDSEKIIIANKIKETIKALSKDLKMIEDSAGNLTIDMSEEAVQIISPNKDVSPKYIETVAGEEPSGPVQIL